eukprot:snap_masked-scaffold_7-processed-gene-0.2-mRNA-1 protein AED:1.00 eAED:1.00 QI:0/0/0/0/1/1/2/0/624
MRQENDQTLIIDSGASYHCCGTKHIKRLKNIQRLEKPKLVGAAGGKIYSSMKKGVFEATLDNNVKITLYDVYIFEDLQVFLVSMAVLMTKGLTIMAEKDSIMIRKNKATLYTANKDENNLFKIKYCSSKDNDESLNTKTNDLMVLTNSTASKIQLLHNKFGHQGKEAFKLTMNYYKYKVNEEELKNFVCKVCENNNIKKGVIKRKDAVGFEGQDGEFFVLDTVDVLTSSRAGNSGFVLATDISSKYRFIFCYKKKSEVTNELIKFFRWFQVATDKKIKRVHSDQGRELYNEQIINYYEENGIHYSVSAPGVPEHNGLAERSNQFILRKMRLILNATNLNSSMYWDFAAYYTVYLTNRTTEGLNENTAHEKIFNKKPDEKKLLIFGSLVIYLKNFDNKVEQRGEEAYFLGYNYVTGEALLLSKNKRQLIKTRNFKLSKRTEEEKLDTETDTVIQVPYVPENSEKAKEPENENTVQVTGQEEEERNHQLLPEQEYIRRSSRKSKAPERLTYCDVAKNEAFYLFEDLDFLFQHHNLMDFAASAMNKDKTIPKTYFQIQSKPLSDQWYTAYEKELNKLITIREMQLIQKTEIKQAKIIPIMELFTKKKDNITNQDICLWPEEIFKMIS